MASATSQLEKALPPSEHDLSTDEGMLAYLNQHTPFSTSSITRLSGGFANWTYRATLESPYKFVDGANQSRALETIVVKFSSDVAAAFAGVALDLYRTKAEIAALKLINGLNLPNFRGMGTTQKLPTSATQPAIFLPELLSYDTTNHVGCYVDLGPLPSLKQYLIDHPGSDAVELAAKIGDLLGQFLAGLHLWGYQVSHTDPSILDIYRQSESAKKICAWRTIEFVEGSAKEYNIDGNWEKITETLKREVLDSNDTFNMGDFWTGNILMELDGPANPRSLKALYILDWELVKTGPASTDIAQFAAEAFMLRQYSGRATSGSGTSDEPTDASPAGEALLVSFLDGYERHVKKSSTDNMTSRSSATSVVEPSYERGKSTQDVLLDSRSVIGHLCAHVATIGKTVSWANRETTGRTVRRVLELMITNDQSDTTSSLKDVLTALEVK
ncbi:Carboxy-terminal domain (CTD) phosphatase [Serendipita sp. 400]|nr:Carboxy-terminal domain (CTD) phosphatase [Serendipita sp. 400]